MKVPLKTWIEFGVARARAMALGPADSLESCESPFNHNPIVTVYPHHAYAIGILAPDGIYGGEVIDNYINLGFPHRFSANKDMPYYAAPDFAPYVGVGFYPDPKLLRVNRWENSGWVPQDNRRVTEMMVAALKKGNYLEVFLNKFFIKGTSAYLGRDHRHYILIIGYSKARNAFTCMGLLEDGTFARIEVLAEILIAGMKSAGGRDDPAFFPFDRINEITRIASQPIEPDRQSVIAYLSDFFASRESFHPKLPVEQRVKPETGIFGLAFFERFFDDIKEAARDQQSVDLRVTRMIWEAHRVMRLRVQYWINQGETKFASLTEACASLEKGAMIIHLSAFEDRQRAKKGGQANYDQLYERLEKLLHDQTVCWGKLKDELSLAEFRRPQLLFEKSK